MKMRMNKPLLTIATMLAFANPTVSALAQQAPSVVFKPGAKAAVPAYKRQAVNHMNAGRFQEAYDVLQANLAANQGDIDTRFMLGQCAARLNKADEALALYEGILADSPDLPRVRLELARVYMSLGKRDKAREAFESVQATNPPPVVGENIQRFLDSIAAQRPWQARLALSYVVDTNVNSGPGSISALPGATDDSFTGQKDTAWGVNGGFSYTYSLNPNTALQFEFSFFSLDYQSQDDSDQLIGSLSAGPSWKRDDMVISFPLIMDHTVVGHDYYSHSYGVAPQVRYNLDKDRSINGAFSISSREHRTTSQDRDGNAFGLNLSYRQQLESGFLQPGLRVTLEQTQQNYFDAWSFGANLGWFTKLPGNMTLYVQPSVSRILKGVPDPFYAGLGCSGCGKTQFDWQYQLTANLNKPLDKSGTNLSVGATLTRNDSNIALTDYQRGMLTVMLTRRF